MFRLQRQKKRSHKNALDAILTSLYQGVECCVKLFVFARVSCICSSDAHGFFTECFIGCQQTMRRRRVTATRELQHDTSLRNFFVFGALVPATLLATWWGSGQIDDGWGGQSYHSQNSKHPRHAHSSCTWRLFRRPCSPIFSDLGAAKKHEPSLYCQPRTTSRRGQHARPRPTLPITRSNRMTNTRDMCLDCLVAVRTDLGMNWRRTFSECFQSVFTAWRSCVSHLALGRGLKCAHNHNKMGIGSPNSQDRTDATCLKFRKHKLLCQHNIHKLQRLNKKHNPLQSKRCTTINAFLRSRDIFSLERP